MNAATEQQTIAALEDRAADMQTSLDHALADLRALEAAARAILPLIQPGPRWPHPRSCQECGARDPDPRHDPTCPIGILTALLED